jgi:hypothetical protein
LEDCGTAACSPYGWFGEQVAVIVLLVRRGEPRRLQAKRRQKRGGREGPNVSLTDANP